MYIHKHLYGTYINSSLIFSVFPVCIFNQIAVLPGIALVYRARWAVATEVTKLLREKLKTPLSPTQEDSYSMLFPKAVTDLTEKR